MIDDRGVECVSMLLVSVAETLIKIWTAGVNQEDGQKPRDAATLPLCLIFFLSSFFSSFLLFGGSLTIGPGRRFRSDFTSWSTV